MNHFCTLSLFVPAGNVDVEDDEDKEGDEEEHRDDHHEVELGPPVVNLTTLTLINCMLIIEKLNSN